MADTIFNALDGVTKLPVPFGAKIRGDNSLSPYRTTDPEQQAELVNAIQALSLSTPTYSTFTTRDAALVANVAQNVFPGGGAPKVYWFKNEGPEDAWYRVNGVATAAPGGGNRKLNVGDSVTFSFKTAAYVSMISPNGTQS